MSASQRETWTHDGRPRRRIGASSTSCARRSTRPGVPSWRVNVGGAAARVVGEQAARAEDRRAPRRGRAPRSWARTRRSRAGSPRCARDRAPPTRTPRVRTRTRRRRQDVGAQEVPGLAGEVVGVVEADVAAPDDGRPSPAAPRSARPAEGRGRSPRRPGLHAALASAGRLLGQRPLVDARARRRRARRRRRTAPCRRLWMRLVTAKKSGVALDHHPARVDAGAARVGEQRVEQLGHAAAASGRVDVPDDAPVEQLARTAGCRARTRSKRSGASTERNRAGLIDAISISYMLMLGRPAARQVEPSPQRLIGQCSGSYTSARSSGRTQSHRRAGRHTPQAHDAVARDCAAHDARGGGGPTLAASRCWRRRGSPCRRRATAGSSRSWRCVRRARRAAATTSSCSAPRVRAPRPRCTRCSRARIRRRSSARCSRPITSRWRFAAIDDAAAPGRPFDVVHDHCGYTTLAMADRQSAPMVHTVHGPFDQDTTPYYARHGGEGPASCASAGRRRAWRRTA